MRMESLLADLVSENKQAMQWDGKDEKDIDRHERVLFSINNPRFFHLSILNQKI